MKKNLDVSIPLVLLGGAENTLSVTRSLGRRGVKIYVIAPETCMANHSRYCRRSWCVPTHLDEETYYQQMLFDHDFSFLHGSIILPCSDRAISFIATYFAELNKHYCLDSASAEQQLAMLNKQRTLELAEQAGCPVPKLWQIRQPTDIDAVVDDISFPLLIKPVLSHLFQHEFGIKLFYVKNVEQLHQQAQRVFDAGLDFILCEYIPGPDSLLSSTYTYIDDNGEELFCFTKRIIRRSPKNYGSGCLHATEWLPKTAEMGMQFFRGIGFRGLGNVEFKLDIRDNQLKIIECNPRFTAAQELLYRSGMDIAELIYRKLSGQHCKPIHSYREHLYYWYPEDDFDAFRDLKNLGEITFFEWLKSLLHSMVFPYLSISDPWPFFTIMKKRIKIRGHGVIRNLSKEAW